MKALTVAAGICTVLTLLPELGGAKPGTGETLARGALLGDRAPGVRLVAPVRARERAASFTDSPDFFKLGAGETAAKASDRSVAHSPGRSLTQGSPGTSGFRSSFEGAKPEAGYWVVEFRRRWKLELLRRHNREHTIDRLRRTLMVKAYRPVIEGVWIALARCESGNDWDYNGGSGFDGGLQFHPGTWNAYRRPWEPRYAYQAPPDVQVAVARRVLAAQGWGAWPACSRKLGLR